MLGIVLIQTPCKQRVQEGEEVSPRTYCLMLNAGPIEMGSVPDHYLVINYSGENDFQHKLT